MTRWTPAEFLGYATSTIFIIILIGLAYDGWQALDGTWHAILGFMVLAPVTVAFPCFILLKLWAMYKIDTSTGRITRRKTS